MKSLIRIILSFVFLTSCSNNPSEPKRISTDYHYQGAITSNFFMAHLPKWADYNQSFKCQRNKEIRYVNLEKIRKSYNLSYSQALQFQYSLEIEKRKHELITGRSGLSIREEEQIFLKVMDAIQSYIFNFKKPKYKRIHLVEIDSILLAKESEKKIRKVLNKKNFYKGHPVFISMCFETEFIKQKMKEWKLNQNNIRVIGLELFNPYASDGTLTHHIGLDINEFFDKDQKLYLYLNKNQNGPSELRGKFKIIKF